MRPVGEILLELEPLIVELVDDHELQAGDLIYLLYGYLKIHIPECFEVYEDNNSSPILFYGPKEAMKRKKRGKKKK